MYVESADISLPLHEHHMRVRKKLSDAVDEGKISDDKADEIYSEWRKRRKEA